MKKFLLSVLLYSTVLIAAYAIYIAVIVRALNNPKIYELPASKTTLILGDSRTACSAYTGLIANSCNLSHTADPYFVVYGKLKRITDVNPQIKTVVLGCAEHNFSKSVEDKWALNSDLLLWKFTREFYLLSPADVAFLFTHNFKTTLRLFASIPREKTELATRAFKGKVNIRRLGVGGFDRLTHKVNLNKYVAQQVVADTGYSSTEIKYLHKIVDLCEQKKIRLILLSTPVHPAAVEEGVGKEDFQKLLHDQFGNVEYVDYSKFKLADSCFADLTHLNVSGAGIFSRALNERLVAKPE